jgi:hypothetical protein
MVSPAPIMTGPVPATAILSTSRIFSGHRTQEVTSRCINGGFSNCVLSPIEAQGSIFVALVRRCCGKYLCRSDENHLHGGEAVCQENVNITVTWAYCSGKAGKPQAEHEASNEQGMDKIQQYIRVNEIRDSKTEQALLGMRHTQQLPQRSPLSLPS